MSTTPTAMSVPAVSEQRHNQGGAVTPVTSRRMPLTTAADMPFTPDLPEQAMATRVLTGAPTPIGLQP